MTPLVSAMNVAQVAGRMRVRASSSAVSIGAPVIADTWSKLNATYPNGNVRAGPYIGQGWSKPCIHVTTGHIYYWQGLPTSANGGSFIFRPSIGYWEKLNSDTSDWKKSFLGAAENYDIVHDPDRNVIWRSTGGPFSSGGAPGGYNNGPYYGEMKYDIAADLWSTPYKEVGNGYVPAPGDVPYFDYGPFGTPGTQTGSNGKYIYYNGALYQFGAFSSGSGAQALTKRDIASGVISTLLTTAQCPPWTSIASHCMYDRSGLNSRTKKLWTLADNLAYNELDLRLPTLSWSAIPTTGTRPTVPAPSAYPGYTDGDYGISAVIDEAANCLVAWCGRNEQVTADGGADQRKTWIMDLATRVWREGPSLAGGHVVPPASVQCLHRLLYDPVGERTLLVTIVPATAATDVWALQIAPIGGIITSWPLPTSSGSTYGVNYYGFPFTANGSAKHVCMAYCPLNNRIYAQGGDSIHSATDGTFSVSLDDGSWRLDVGAPVYPTLPAPHALQDGFGMFWVASVNQFVLIPGGYYPYPPPIDPVANPLHNYSKGYWWFDPSTNVYTQDLRLFTDPYSSTGCLHGGAWDDVNEHVIVLADSSAGKAVRRWDPLAGVRLADLTLSIPNDPAYPGLVFQRSRQVACGRWVYAAGYKHDGTPSGRVPLMVRWNMDTHATEVCATPPVSGPAIIDLEVRLAVSHGKIVWLFHNGPEGNIISINVYDPSTNTWTQDSKRPAYGNFIGNSICETDRHVCMSGGVFGLQQSHFWLYEAT